MTAKAKAFIAAVITAGAATVAFALIHWRSDDLTRLLCVSVIVRCRGHPQVPGTWSHRNVFSGVFLHATWLRDLVLLRSSGRFIVQCTFKPQRRPSLIQICFITRNVTLRIEQTDRQAPCI